MTKDPGNIRIEDFTYDLPDNRIARYPLKERDSSRLLVWNGSVITDRVFSDLPGLINPGSLMVFNNTRVIRARLLFKKESGAAIEIFCLEPYDPREISSSLSSPPGVEWICLVGNLKRWKNGRLTAVFRTEGIEHELHAERISASGDAFRIRFEWDDPRITFGEILDSLGHVPIPPYLGREDEESDRKRYQTTYASVDGSVAAPTAGLHFTPAVREGLIRAGIEQTEVTLHVSAGTFRPVKSEKISDHKMHTEHFFISADVLRKLKHDDITAVGTTTVRTLESIYWLGAAIAAGRIPEEEIPSVSQWEPYANDSQISSESALNHLLEWMRAKNKAEVEAKTDIIIVPGYKFRIVKGLVTNFHQPGSTLLLLVAALTGDSWKDIYSHALSSGYRFLSYGDSMLLLPGNMETR
jgi:S-adenosylmethionine:tRNA ribosyltransferase-isomerase